MWFIGGIFILTSWMVRYYPILWVPLVLLGIGCWVRKYLNRIEWLNSFRHLVKDNMTCWENVAYIESQIKNRELEGHVNNEVSDEQIEEDESNDTYSWPFPSLDKEEQESRQHIRDALRWVVKDELVKQMGDRARKMKYWAKILGLWAAFFLCCVAGREEHWLIGFAAVPAWFLFRNKHAPTRPDSANWLDEWTAERFQAKENRAYNRLRQQDIRDRERKRREAKASSH